MGRGKIGGTAGGLAAGARSADAAPLPVPGRGFSRNCTHTNTTAARATAANTSTMLLLRRRSAAVLRRHGASVRFPVGTEPSEGGSSSSSSKSSACRARALLGGPRFLRRARARARAPAVSPRSLGSSWDEASSASSSSSLSCRASCWGSALLDGDFCIARARARFLCLRDFFATAPASLDHPARCAEANHETAG